MAAAYRLLCLTRTAPLATLVLVGLLAGCAMPPKEVVLDYALAPSEQPVASMQGLGITISPFADARTNTHLYRRMLVMREQDSAGIWVANALRMELERAGARIDAVEEGVLPRQGHHLSGRVNIVEASPVGWQPGGLLGVLTGSGYVAHINLLVQFFENGVPLLSKQYNCKRRYRTDAAKTILVGQDPSQDVPRALQEALRGLVVHELLPDVVAAAKRPSEAKAEKE